LAEFAIEELGRSTILLKSWRQVLTGENITLEEVRKRCSNQRAHQTKQEAGMLSIVLTGDDDPEFGKWLRIKMGATRQRPSGRRRTQRLHEYKIIKNKRLPKERHQARLCALYVDPKFESEWRRPIVYTSPADAVLLLRSSVNDYAGRYHNRYITSRESGLQHHEPDLYHALKEWSDRPELPRPEWPTMSPE
jgi:AbiV family abortive infection protein